MSNAKKARTIQSKEKDGQHPQQSPSRKTYKQKKSSAKEKAWFSEMNQVAWFPFDSYAD